MNEVTLVKVTLNEATDPDLYAYIMRFDNPRVRAGAIRALARAALSGDRSHSAGDPIPAIELPPVAMPGLTAQYGSRDMQTNAAASKPDLQSHPDPIARRETATTPSTDASSAGNGRRFDTDAIADQFAQF
ncbi:hypothetical protein ACFQ3P_33145 [Paraburkholderia sabiae]|uniref:HEAT repeat domain-containing protein n=1 Tax=Paraburkholderia sabiae TaxID=273251 RepID=A0ABU9QJ90_9BURK|nr:hypothetical protein [Paraburkholderia sabiae]WJZ79800.1 hypothetical protein QEN71_43975 [Paraburkholderia sabiae]CAD6559228.1 hypothetical protein LMG24235_06597 [Paraburkholderia sabiae]